jgi:RND family efflux transporter MFP subunit
MSAPSRKSSLGLRILLTLLAIAAIVVVVIYSLRPVARVVAVRRGHAIDARPGSVLVVASYQEPITSEVGGRLVKSALQPGQAFHEGDFMAQIDPGDIDLDIERAQNDLAALKAHHAVGSRIALDIETAQATLDNDERLYKMGQVATTAILAERRGLRILQQQLAGENVDFETTVKADELAIKEQQRKKSKMTILAPFSGVVSEVMAQQGALLGGVAPVATLIADQRRVEVRVSEEKFPGITVGKKANVQFLGDNGRFYDAKVAQILPTVEAETQRYVVYLDVDIPRDRLTPGITGEATIEVDTHPDALLVPRRALAGDRLLVVNGGQVELRTVKTGYKSLTDVEVLDGVKQGDLVIAEDLDAFHPGERVSTVELTN